MGRKLRTEQIGIFPGNRPDRFSERDMIVSREMAKRAGLPDPRYSTSNYENLGNRELPIFNKKEQIKRMIRDSPISMLEGPTGSGKSTQIGQYALEMGYEKIVYLEGTIILANNLADRLAFELTEQVGTEDAAKLVGAHHSERTDGIGRRIEVMTPDTFIRAFHDFDQFEDEPFLVVGDEIHRKDFATELGVSIMARQLEDHPKWRLALVSATIDAAAIQDAYASKMGREVPSVAVEGRPYDLAIIELPELTASEAYMRYGRDHQKTQIFVAGKQEIKDTSNDIRNVVGGNILITPLHAKLPRRDVLRATNSVLAPGQRQVIPSTNAGESGITIPGETLVITDGVVRRPDLDLDGTPGLFKQYAARDEMIQAGGRAGRDVEGGKMLIVRPDDQDFEFRPLDERRVHAPAQIYHTNISTNVLAVTVLGFDFYQQNKWLINSVDDSRVSQAYETLYRLQAIDKLNHPTELGKYMAKFPLRPEFSRCIAEAVHDHADAAILYQLAAIVSSVEAGGLPYFEKGVGEKWRKDIRESTGDDYIAQLDMFLATRSSFDGTDVDEIELTARNYDTKNVCKAHRSYDKICRVLGLDSSTLPGEPTDAQIAKIHEFLTAGLFDLAHRRREASGDHRGATYVRLRPSLLGGTERELSSRGTYRGNDELVIGMPRRYEKHVNGELREFSVIENVAPTTKQNIAKYALWLAERSPLSPRVVGGRIVETDQLLFGDVVLDTRKARNVAELAPKAKQLLVEAALNGSTQTIEQLKNIKTSIEWLVRRVPMNEIDDYFHDGVMTHEWLVEQVNAAVTTGVDSVYALDNNLRRYAVENDISIETWISDAKVKEILERSPSTVMVGSNNYQLYYTHGRPIINRFNLVDADALPDELQLADGREIYITHTLDKANAKHYPAITIKRYAESLD